MFTRTLTFNGKAAQNIKDIDIAHSVMVTVNIDAKTAQRRATGWLISEVGNMIIGGTPELVITTSALWRVPALLTSSKIGTVGQVGTVDVDAVTGKLLVHDELIENILHHVKHIASPIYSSIG